MFLISDSSFCLCLLLLVREMFDLKPVERKKKKTITEVQA